MHLKNLHDAAVDTKKVLVRLDTDVPLSETNEILDSTRLTAGMPTITSLIEKNATVFICGHMGRPKGVVTPSLSLLPVAQWFVQKLGGGEAKETKIGEFSAWKVAQKVFLLENLRFFPGEEANDDAFAKQLASVADVYVDDAFAVSHRAAASNVGITKFLPSFAGLQLQKEIEGLGKVLDDPNRPLVVIIGGAKLETKVPLVEKMHNLADTILVGGKLIQEKETLNAFIEKKGRARIVIAASDETGLDIAKESADMFASIIKSAKTIVWNGPVGKTNGDDEKLAGSRAVAQAMMTSGAYTVIGGGDTIEFLDREKIVDKYSFVSTGGGAMLSFLSGETLPALIPLMS